MANFRPSPELPAIFSLIINDYQASLTSENERKKFKNLIQEIDDQLIRIKKKDFIFILNTEVKKNILEYYKDEETKSFTSKDFELLKIRISKLGFSEKTFSHWLTKSILNDFDELIASPFIKSQNRQSKKLAIFKRKLELLSPWGHILKDKTKEDIQLIIIYLQKNILRNTLRSLEFYSTFAGLSPSTRKKNQGLVFFELSGDTINEPPGNKKKTMTSLKSTQLELSDLLIDSNIKKNQQWLPRDQKPSENFIPFEPPKPINDWLLDANSR